jgi:twitching motility protein PilI
MARKTSLREFQQRVADRLRDLSSRKTFASKLGFQIGNENWLVNLSDVSEVIPVPTFLIVPQTRAWFRGVANVRGKLYSVVDFAEFQGQEATSTANERRVILIQERILESAGFLVNRMLGLRNPENFTREDKTDALRPWVGAHYRDANGMEWRELDLRELAKTNSYLDVSIPFHGVADVNVNRAVESATLVNAS